MTTSSESEWARAVKVIDGASQVCLACHVRPDADALGSMLAMLHALGTRPGGAPSVVASFGDEPFEIPAILRFLPGLELLTPPDGYPAQPEVMLSFDAGSIDRLGALTWPAEAAGELIVLDHHASNAGFGTINLVDPAAAATAVLAAELVDRLGIPLTEQIALGLYAGLVTDTGSFKFSATTPAVHELAARLLATGIDPGVVSRELYDRAPFSYLGLLAAALGRVRLEPEAAGEGCEPTKQGPLVRLKEVVTPLEGRLERLLPCRRSMARRAENPEPVVEPLRDRRGTECSEAAGRELECQWQAVESKADSGNIDRVLLVKHEARCRRSSALHEQPHGFIAHQVARPERLLGVRDVERRNPEHDLARHAQGLATGGEDREPWR